MKKLTQKPTSAQRREIYQSAYTSYLKGGLCEHLTRTIKAQYSFIHLYIKKGTIDPYNAGGSSLKEYALFFGKDDVYFNFNTNDDKTKIRSIILLLCVEMSKP